MSEEIQQPKKVKDLQVTVEDVPQVSYGELVDETIEKLNSAGDFQGTELGGEFLFGRFEPLSFLHPAIFLLVFLNCLGVGAFYYAKSQRSVTVKTLHQANEEIERDIKELKISDETKENLLAFFKKFLE